MNMGWPADQTWYRLLTDWGSVIGGIFALVAGGAAYLAGYLQASATRQAAKMQVEAGEKQRSPAEDTAQRQLRAYLVADMSSVTRWEQGKTAEAETIIKNTGLTPPTISKAGVPLCMTNIRYLINSHQ
jgi:hypothetical protein